LNKLIQSPSFLVVFLVISFSQPIVFLFSFGTFIWYKFCLSISFKGSFQGNSLPPFERYTAEIREQTQSGVFNSKWNCVFYLVCVCYSLVFSDRANPRQCRSPSRSTLFCFNKFRCSVRIFILWKTPLRSSESTSRQINSSPYDSSKDWIFDGDVYNCLCDEIVIDNFCGLRLASRTYRISLHYSRRSATVTQCVFSRQSPFYTVIVFTRRRNSSDLVDCLFSSTTK